MSDEQKTELQAERETMEAAAKTENESRNGVGLRVMVGATRGKNTQNIKYEAFDESKPDTLPGSIAEFASVTNITEESKLVEFLITGFNDFQYKQASDPIAEFVNAAWPDDVKLAFRTSVRNYAKAMEEPIDEVAKLFAAKLNKKFAAQA